MVLGRATSDLHRLAPRAPAYGKGHGGDGQLQRRISGEAFPEKKNAIASLTHSPELGAPRLSARAPRVPSTWRWRCWRRGARAAATGSACASPQSARCSRDQIRLRMAALAPLPSLGRDRSAPTIGTQTHRAASESTVGDLLLVKDEGALLLAHRHALHEETSAVVRVVRAELVGAATERGWLNERAQRTDRGSASGGRTAVRSWASPSTGINKPWSGGTSAHVALELTHVEPIDQRSGKRKADGVWHFWERAGQRHEHSTRVAQPPECRFLFTVQTCNASATAGGTPWTRMFSSSCTVAGRTSALWPLKSRSVDPVFDAQWRLGSATR
eukprot:scaffold64137_cov96-Phaeocystis_antarctica.AAC.2